MHNQDVQAAAEAAAKDLAAAITESDRLHHWGYGPATVQGRTVCWDGPYDWIACTLGSTIWAGDTGEYSRTPTDDEQLITTAIKRMGERGFYLEVECQGRVVVTPL